MKFSKPNFKPNIRPPKLKVMTLEIEKYDNNLNGVSYKGGKRYVVEDTVVGDVVKVAAVETFNNITYCGLLAVVSPSENRIAPKCRYYSECGGCNMMNVSPAEELKIKTDYVKRRLFPFGTEVADAVAEKGFRNKITLAFEKSDGKLKIGFMNDKTKNVTDVAGCLMHDKSFADLVRALRFWVEDNDVSVYNPRYGTGVLRFVVARYLDGQLLVTVVGTKPLPQLEDLYKKLSKKFASVGLYENVNTEKTNEALSGDICHKFGKRYIESMLSGVLFKLGPESFFQTNAAVCERIYADAFKIVQERAPETVYDLYSGIGITSALFSKAAKKVVSIEIVPQAVASQRELVAANGIDNVQILEGSIEEVLPTMQKTEGSLFFVDPPRRGLADGIDAILDFAPDTVLYLSCNPDTLVKDLEKFVGAGYKATSATPYNMFRATKHVETMVVIEKVRK